MSFWKGPRNAEGSTGLVDLAPTFPLFINARHMYRAFTGALALALTILVLHWTVPELTSTLVEDMLKALHLIGVLLDLAAGMVNTTADTSMSS